MQPTADVVLLLFLIIFLICVSHFIVLFFIGQFSLGQVKVVVSSSWMMDQRFGGGSVTYPAPPVRGRAKLWKQQFRFLALGSSCCPTEY